MTNAPRKYQVVGIGNAMVDVLAHAAELLGLPIPPAVPIEEAEMTPMARSFYAESKRVRNDRIKTELSVRLRYPDYRAGLAAMLNL